MKPGARILSNEGNLLTDAEVVQPIWQRRSIIRSKTSPGPTIGLCMMSLTEIRLSMNPVLFSTSRPMVARQTESIRGCEDSVNVLGRCVAEFYKIDTMRHG